MTTAIPSPTAFSHLTDADLAAEIVAELKRRNNPALADALMVRVLNNAAPVTTMFDRDIVDTLDNADQTQRLGYTVSPYGSIKAGALCTIIAEDENHEPYVLLGQREGENLLRMPEGFMNPKGASNSAGLYVENDETQRDLYERSLLKPHAEKAAHAINRLTSTMPKFDTSLEDTAVREVQEETGLVLDKRQLQWVENTTDANLSKTIHGEHPWQQVVNRYVVDLRGQHHLPPISAGDDLKEPHWVKLSEIQPMVKADGSIVVAAGGVPLQASHYLRALEHAVAKLRTLDLAQYGVTREAIKDFSHLPTPASELGQEAVAYHQNALLIAQKMKSRAAFMDRSVVGKAMGHTANFLASKADAQSSVEGAVR